MRTYAAMTVSLLVMCLVAGGPPPQAGRGKVYYRPLKSPEKMRTFGLEQFLAATVID